MSRSRRARTRTPSSRTSRRTSSTTSQDAWARTFEASGRPYERAKVVFYDGAVDTACGSASSAVGPFYCPGDRRVYLDLSFYDDMERQLGAPGDFAWAYVIAHELGHHVQQQLGTSDEVNRIRRTDPDKANDASVRLELQADCYAGVWARGVFDQLEPGDLDEALTASEAVGDDRLQQQAGQRINPDSFTHGSSEQRRRWFERGRERGEPADCDTFSADDCSAATARRTPALPTPRPLRCAHRSASSRSQVDLAGGEPAVAPAVRTSSAPSSAMPAPVPSPPSQRTGGAEQRVALAERARASPRPAPPGGAPAPAAGRPAPPRAGGRAWRRDRGPRRAARRGRRRR